MVKVTMMSVVMGMMMMAMVVAGRGHHHHNKVASAPAPSATDCSTIVYDMMDCVSYVSSGSNETEPSKDCCSGLKTVLKTDPACLCEAMKQSAQLGIVVNATRAKDLPSACGQTTAPPDCGLPESDDSPSASPVAPPESSPSTPSTMAPSPSDELSGAPVEPPNSSSAYTTAFSFALAVVGLLLSSL